MTRPPLRSAAAAAALLLAGCFFGKVPETKYYVLDYVPTPPAERVQKGTYPFVLRMRDCSIAEAYRRSQIVYRQSANQMQFYGLHLWAVDPDRMLTDLAVKHLKAARLFENVTRTVENYVPDYYLSCDVQAIEEYDSKDQAYSHLAIEYQLEDAKSNQIAWKKLFDLRKSVPQPEPIYVVRELSVLAETINERLTQELEVVLDEARYRQREKADSAQADSAAKAQR
jgi:cholesterol transport system auxiliary component